MRRRLEIVRVLDMTGHWSNTPFLARVDFNDMGIDTAWSGHDHWFVFVLGWWLHVHTPGSRAC
jgi:hypothetical protein